MGSEPLGIQAAYVRVDQDDAHLRPLLASDAGAVLAGFLSNPDMSRQGKVLTLADAELYVTNLLTSASQHPWAISREGTLVGLVCVSIDEANRTGWVSYWMNHAARGNGWMSRAVATVAEWALAAGGLERLELGHRVNNPASGAVARAAGFVKEGTERAKFLIDGERIDVDTYGRLRTDPAPSFVPLEIRE